MGIFSFIKNAGAKVFGIGKTDAEKAAESAEAIAIASAEAANKLKETVSDLDLSVESLEIIISGDVATVSGIASDQATKEKVVLVVGNTEGIATVNDLMEIAVAEEAVAAVPESQFHTVVSGDSLSKIAKHFYGNAMKYPVIFEANQPMLKSPDLIYPGQVLRIPALD